MKILLIIYVAVMSLITFAVFGLDKYKAKADKWRTPEKTLFILAILGGGIGAFLGMQIFRHKTQHKQFVIGIPLIMILQLILIAWLWIKVLP